MGKRTASGRQLAEATDAIERHRWHDAYALLQATDPDALAASDLRHLADAAWWTGHLDEAIDALERAFRLDLATGDVPVAAKAALDLAGYYGHKLNSSMSQGWFSRAERILENQPESFAHGYLERARSGRCLSAGRFEEALEHAKEAERIGVRHGDPDVQAIGLHQQGLILVASGKVEAGTELLDEAAIPAVGGELGPTATATIYCNIISTCRDLSDYRRAAEWTEAARRWCDRQAISGFPGHCRVFRAEIMRLRGSWLDAENEARRACEELRGFSPAFAGEAFQELGEIRLRMGDFQAAREAFALANELGAAAQPGLALLHLREGRVSVALAAIQRALDDESWDRLRRARLLPVLTEIAVEANELGKARAAAEELRELAAAYGTPALEAAANTAAGMVALADGDAAAAIHQLGRAHRLWLEVDLPYEAARARLSLGRAYQARGDHEAAAAELEGAMSSFDRLGARVDGELAKRLLDSLPAPRTDGSVKRQSRAFMFSDICDSTKLLEAIGDEAWEPLLTWHDQTLRQMFAGHGGEEIKHSGDGFFVAFPNVSVALDCAVAIQRTLAEHRRSHGFAPQVRVGVHAAEATRRGADFAGKGVHVAARIGAQAGAAEILVSSESCAETVLRYPVSQPRTVALKGIAAPVQVVNVHWR